MTRPTDAVVLGDGATSALRTINLGIYAHPGKGKTPLAGTGGAKMLIMDSDHGVESAEAFGSKATVVPVTDYRKLDDVYEWLRDEAIPKGEFDWVWWDSLTLFQDRTLLDEITGDAHLANPEKQSPDVPSQREYLIDHNRVKRYVRMFVDLPINFGVSFHVTTQEDPDTEEIIYMPAVQGKGMSSAVCGYLNVVGFLSQVKVEGKKTTVPKLLFRQNGKWHTKDRFNALPGVMSDPSIPKIEEAINAKRRRPTTPPAAQKTAARKPAGRQRRTSTSN